VDRIVAIGVSAGTAAAVEAAAVIRVFAAGSRLGRRAASLAGRLRQATRTISALDQRD
jgi:hypothetical protein